MKRGTTVQAFSSEASSSCGIRDGQGKVVYLNMDDKRINPKWEQIYKCQRPVVFKNLLKGRAPLRWLEDFDVLKNRLGLSREDDDAQVVPIEIGRGSYMSESGEFDKIHVGLSSLLDTLSTEMEIIDGKEKKADHIPWYLAQAEVKSISPVLHEDLGSAPKLCTTGKGDLYRTQLWLNGAAGSFSPCHIDPFNNLLCQLYGEKTVTLYDCPAPYEAMYPSDDTIQKNTSRIPFGPILRKDRGHERIGAEVDRSSFPSFHDPSKRTVYGPVTLQPGDSLFIPFKFWHLVSAPSVSCSVSYWWL